MHELCIVGSSWVIGPCVMKQHPFYLDKFILVPLKMISIRREILWSGVRLFSRWSCLKDLLLKHNNVTSICLSLWQTKILCQNLILTRTWITRLYVYSFQTYKILQHYLLLLCKFNLLKIDFDTMTI